MWTTISYYFRVPYNFLRLSLLSLLNGFRISWAPVQKFSVKAHLSVGLKGKIEIGPRCMAEAGTLLRAGTGMLRLGERIFFNRNCTVVCNESIEIGDKSTFGPNVCIFDHDHDQLHWNHFIGKPIRIGSKVWVGANVVILKGVTIGNNAIVGAGTVVTKDIPPDTVCYCRQEICQKKIH